MSYWDRTPLNRGSLYSRGSEWEISSVEPNVQPELHGGAPPSVVRAVSNQPKTPHCVREPVRAELHPSRTSYDIRTEDFLIWAAILRQLFDLAEVREQS